jgi:hypothetical protein
MHSLFRHGRAAPSEGRHRFRSPMPGHPRLSYLSEAKTWMPGIADKLTQSAQGRLLRPGMTSFTIRDSEKNQRPAGMRDAL